MTETHAPQCVFCDRTSQEVPLLALNFKDNQYYICSEHLPVLIHSPYELEGRLPGADKLKPHGS